MNSIPSLNINEAANESGGAIFRYENINTKAPSRRPNPLIVIGMIPRRDIVGTNNINLMIGTSIPRDK